MFTDDVEKTTIDGMVFYTFQPNTIVYAVDINSDIGKQINKAKNWCCLAHNILVILYQI